VLRNRFRHERVRPPLHSLNGQDKARAAADHANDAETSARIARALAALPEHYEAVLRAKYLEQQSVADIAAERRESEKAVESLLTRARQAFRDVYSQEE
jgi:RNA polymerase sigma-70 factor, ECF subfamily